MDEKIVKDSHGLVNDLVNDTISRQAAIDALEKIDCSDGVGISSLKCDAVDDAVTAIKALPSAQPENTRKRTESHACDLISRAMLLECIHNDPVGKMLCDKYNLDGVIKQFPSAQPKSYREGYQAGYKDAQSETAERTAETAQNVSDGDLISRKAAMNRIDEALSRVFVDSHGCGETALRGLPSVKLERKRGHWVGIDDEPCETWECDQCGYIQEFFDGDQPNYCPNCGAEMSKE